MKMNFKGLVDLHTLPKTTPLLPLYEAIINSIQSIEEAQAAGCTSGWKWKYIVFVSGLLDC